MHPFAIDSDEHQSVFIRLVIPAVLVAIAIHYGLDWTLVTVDIENPLWLQALVGPITAGGLLALMLGRFEQSWWRVGWIRRSLGITTPDLNGRWEVSGESSYRGGERLWTAEASIEQTWFRLCIHQESQMSTSKSTSAAIQVKHSSRRPILTYEYRNDPKPHSGPALLPHRGFAELQMSPPDEPLRLTGDYYTHPKFRSNYGSLTLTRLS